MLASADNLLQRLVVTTLLPLAIWLTPDTAMAAQSAKADPAPTACVYATTSEVAELFSSWNLALASLDPARVTAMYWPDAVLLPTVSNIPRKNAAAIKDYFVHFLQRFPRGEITDRSVHLGCNTALDMGLYVFSVMDANGRASSVAARYTFVYAHKNGVWKIQHHHSSAMPEPASTTSSSPAIESGEHAHDAPPPSPRQAPQAVSPETPPRAASTANKGSAKIRLASASRTANSWLSPEQRRKVGRDTVGLKICGTGGSTARTFEVSAPSPFTEANEAALSWARAARWTVTGEPESQESVCAQVVVRFTDAGL
jgi:uncharacterized protein (TIGR02246 family)